MKICWNDHCTPDIVMGYLWKKIIIRSRDNVETIILNMISVFQSTLRFLFSKAIHEFLMIMEFIDQRHWQRIHPWTLAAVFTARLEKSCQSQEKLSPYLFHCVEHGNHEASKIFISAGGSKNRLLHQAIFYQRYLFSNICFKPILTFIRSMKVSTCTSCLL